MGILQYHSRNPQTEKALQLDPNILLPKEIPLIIASRTDFHTIRALICTCKYYSEYPNIWKLACQVRFPTKPYFDFWTGIENYLVHKKKNFIIDTDFNARFPAGNRVPNYLYEAGCFISHQYRSQHDWFEINAQFVLINVRVGRGMSLVGQYETFERAKETIKTHQLQIDPFRHFDLDHLFNQYMYTIIDLKDMIPIFKNPLRISDFTIQNIKQYEFKTNPGTFYYGSLANPIKF